MTYKQYKSYIIDGGYLFTAPAADFLGDADEVHIFIEVIEPLDIKGVDSNFNIMGQKPLSSADGEYFFPER
jgi:hypothetical protein